MERQVMVWKKTSVNHTSYNTFSKLNSKKTNKSIKIGKRFDRHFTTVGKWTKNKHMKRCQHAYLLRK
jgi:hypothetical protein